MYNFCICVIIVDLFYSLMKVLVDVFFCKDGFFFEKLVYWVEYFFVGKEFENCDFCMVLIIWKFGDFFLGKLFVFNFMSQICIGYMFKKYGDEEFYFNMKLWIDEILICYVEVLLIFVEVSFELDDWIFDEDLNFFVNVFCNCFEGDFNWLLDLINVFVVEYGLSMCDEICCECRVEFVVELFCYDDIICWKMVEMELFVVILGVKFDLEFYLFIVFGKDVILDKNGFILVQNVESCMFDSLKDYFFFLLLCEVLLNLNLKQNFNW